MKRNEALAKIKILIEKYFQDVGRDAVESVETLRMDLIDEIDEIIGNVNIPAKYMIMDRK